MGQKKTKTERQKETALMLKCGCGNVAAYGTTKCGTCMSRDSEENAILSELDACSDIEALKDFIRDRLI